MQQRDSRTVRILVVEDDEACRYAAAATLRNHGFEVVEACGYRDALPLLEDGSRFDVLVVDLVLPGVNGFALARMARMKHHDLKCIYMTAYDVPIDEAMGPVIHKPFAPGALLDVVAALFPG